MIIEIESLLLGVIIGLIVMFFMLIGVSQYINNKEEEGGY